MYSVNLQEQIDLYTLNSIQGLKPKDTKKDDAEQRNGKQKVNKNNEKKKMKIR